MTDFFLKPDDALPEVALVSPKSFLDERGGFAELIRMDNLADNLFGFDQIVQVNLSRSQKDVVRGLHYQLYKPQGKLIQVIQGEILDVAVDIRESSKNFGIATCQHLSAFDLKDQGYLFWVPPGFAHGFRALSDDVIIQYYCTNYYDPESERSICWNDPALGIDWGITKDQAIVSNKDAVAPLLKDAEIYKDLHV